MQEELVGGKYMRAPADASLADKGRAKGKKAIKRAGATALQGFRKYSSPSDIQVSISYTATANVIAHQVWLRGQTSLADPYVLDMSSEHVNLEQVNIFMQLFKGGMCQVSGALLTQSA